MTKHYAERDLLEMDRAGDFYGNHVMAMTAEQLHSKSDIAAELGWRDMQIANLKEQLTATTNSITNAQEALKSAGIEADTVQAGVMELALMRDKMAAVARDFASTIAWADDVGALSMTELKRYDLDGQCEKAISRAKLDIIDAADAYLNAVRADAISYALKECSDHCDTDCVMDAYGFSYETAEMRSAGAVDFRNELSEFAAQLRAGNAGKGVEDGE